MKLPTKLFPKARSNARFDRGEREAFEEYPDVDRPKTRGDCWDELNGVPIGPRPCPFITCRKNMFLYINEAGSALADCGVYDPLEMPANKSCVLDIVEEKKDSGKDDDATLNPREIGELMKIARQGADVVLESALRSAARAARKLGIKKVHNDGG